MTTPGLPALAQEISGEWIWNSVSKKCLTTVQMTIATAPLSPRYCTEVGYVSGNPGYDPKLTPAKPLKQVAAQAGPAC